jgi:hypothetical protein
VAVGRYKSRLDATKAALADAERAASEAAVSVMSEEAERVATYLDAAKARGLAARDAAARPG